MEEGEGKMSGEDGWRGQVGREDSAKGLSEIEWGAKRKDRARGPFQGVYTSTDKSRVR